MKAAGVKSVGNNRELQVLLIGRRFWPHACHDSAGYLYQLACALHRHGAAVDVLTPRYSSSWPDELTIREIRVQRPWMAPKWEWSMGRYSRFLTGWLRQNSASYDVMLCDSIREESSAAVEASRSSGCPVILRSSGWGQNSDPVWWTTSRAARRCGTVGLLADAVIANSAICQRGLLADGYAQQRVVRIDCGFAAGPVRSATAKWRARQSLGAANHDLATEPDTPVLLCATRMNPGSGVIPLVEAARHLVARYPTLKLWIVGDGPYRDWIYDTLRGYGLRDSIAMPGSFCDLEDLLTAADVYFQGDDDGLEHWLPSAISAEIPIVSVDTLSTRTLIGGLARVDSESAEQWIQWCRPTESPSTHTGAATPKSISIAIRTTFDDLAAAREHATRLRRFLLRTRPQTESIESYLKLMKTVISRRSVRHQGTSAEASS